MIIKELLGEVYDKEQEYDRLRKIPKTLDPVKERDNYIERRFAEIELQRVSYLLAMAITARNTVY